MTDFNSCTIGPLHSGGGRSPLDGFGVSLGVEVGVSVGGTTSSEGLVMDPSLSLGFSGVGFVRLPAFLGAGGAGGAERYGLHGGKPGGYMPGGRTPGGANPDGGGTNPDGGGADPDGGGADPGGGGSSASL